MTVVPPAEGGTVDAHHPISENRCEKFNAVRLLFSAAKFFLLKSRYPVALAEWTTNLEKITVNDTNHAAKWSSQL